MRKPSTEDLNILGAFLLIASIGFLVGFSAVMFAHATAPRPVTAEAGGAL